MRIFGLDFTSNPTPKKPITCAVCEFEGGALTLDCFVCFENFDIFENFFHTAGPWVAGLDLPFGQPRRFIENLGWPLAWEACTGQLGRLDRAGFVQVIEDYRQPRPKGDKHHLRETDRLARSRSPMMLVGVPVGKMYFEGAPRLAASGACILPCRPNDSGRVVVEAYPALVARRFIGSRSYKSDTPGEQTPEREAARRELVYALGSSEIHDSYGFPVPLHDAVRQDLIADAKADHLDALLCAVQAAWAHTQRDNGYGIPSAADGLEGWIVAPGLVPAVSAGNDAAQEATEGLSTPGVK